MKWVLLGVFVFILLIVSVFVYRRYMNKIQYNPNNEYVANSNKGQLMIFYAVWCPYSKKALDKWYNYKESYTGPYNISFTEIDSDENVELADKYTVESYPTIILVLDGKNYIYDAEMNNETLTQFINTIMK